MALFLNQDLTLIGTMACSDLDGLYESDSFKSWKQARDESLKIPGALISRMDGISKQLHALSKLLSKTA